MLILVLPLPVRYPTQATVLREHFCAGFHPVAAALASLAADTLYQPPATPHEKWCVYATWGNGPAACQYYCFAHLQTYGQETRCFFMKYFQLATMKPRPPR